VELFRMLETKLDTIGATLPVDQRELFRILETKLDRISVDERRMLETTLLTLALDRRRGGE
jgi:hypothetical protein